MKRAKSGCAGRVIVGQPDVVLPAMNIPPDFAYTGLSSGGELDWIHRRTDDADIYFVASRWDRCGESKLNLPRCGPPAGTVESGDR